MAPIPPRTPVNKAPSVPNLTLLINCLAGSFLSSSLFISVGPPNKSPKVPIPSTSPTKTPSATPPAAAPVKNFARFKRCLSMSCLVLPATPVVPTASKLVCHVFNFPTPAAVSISSLLGLK